MKNQEVTQRQYELASIAGNALDELLARCMAQAAKEDSFRMNRIRKALQRGTSSLRAMVLMTNEGIPLIQFVEERKSGPDIVICNIGMPENVSS